MTKRHDRFTWKAGDVVVHDDATKAAKSDWAKHPNHELHDKIVATFAPKLAAALTPSRAQIATAIARAKKKADVEAAKALALNFVKDWAEWDAEHPYVPHPRDAAGGTGHDAQGKPADISGDKGTHCKSVPFGTSTFRPASSMDSSCPGRRTVYQSLTVWH